MTMRDFRSICLFVLWWALCVCFALIPEFAMYFSWHLIEPSTDVARVLTLALFWLAGGGMCVLFGFIGFMLWVVGLKAWSES